MTSCDRCVHLELENTALRLENAYQVTIAANALARADRLQQELRVQMTGQPDDYVAVLRSMALQDRASFQVERLRKSA